MVYEVILYIWFINKNLEKYIPWENVCRKNLSLAAYMVLYVIKHLPNHYFQYSIGILNTSCL